MLLLLPYLLLVVSFSTSMLPNFPSLTSDDAHYRKFVELSNKKMIQQHNQLQTTYQLVSNKFISLTLEQFQAKLCSHFDLSLLPPSFEAPPMPQIGATISLASNSIVDWEASGKVSPIKNQGSFCSSCYAFTALADMETSYLIKYGKLYDFSEQQIVDCSSSFGNNPCISGFYLYSFKYIIRNGINLQQNYAYIGSASKCKATVSNSFSISSYYGFNGNSCSILFSLLQQRPVIVSIDGANPYWQFYGSGILTYCGASNTLNHGVQVIAVYSFSNGTSYYVIKNSWGTNWGEKGKMKIDRNTQNGNLCLICSYMYYSIV